HDGAVHGAELVVELRGHHSAGHRRLAEKLAEHRQRLPGIGELPAHHHHQTEAEEEKDQRGDRVLDADDLVVDREEVLAPERQLVVAVIGVRMPVAVAGRGVVFDAHRVLYDREMWATSSLRARRRPALPAAAARSLFATWRTPQASR